MIFYSEEKDGRRTTYVVTSINDETGEMIAQRKVVFPLCQLDYEGFKYFLLYDDNMVPVREVYEYLNFALRDSPLNTRSKIANALRLLYCFLSLSQRTIAEMDEKAFSEFVYFIRGIEINPNEYSLITQRNNNTVNGYFAAYRSFYKHIGVDCLPLFSSHSVLARSLFDGSCGHTMRTKYDHNLRGNSNADRYAPKYISPSEFRVLYQAAKSSGDKQAELIMHLMYGYGMRLGEVLGLTLEDIGEIETNNKLIPVLWLRNRISDKKFQYAKGLPHVASPKQYASKAYKLAQTKIIITRNLYKDLLSYLDEKFATFQEKRPADLALSNADLVSDNSYMDQNYYIFLNRYGKPLSDQVWNNKLKEYYKQAGIKLDSHIRENNLSHRFRHGFAMFHAHFAKHRASELELQQLMRHKSLMSTLVYYNPTPEDELRIKEGFQNELYEMMPELLKGVQDER